MNSIELVGGERRILIDGCAELLHDNKKRDAARLVADFSKFPTSKLTNSAVEVQLLQGLLYWCLNNSHYADAATLLWTPNQFTPKPRCTQLVWNSIDEHVGSMLMGASSMSKSFGGGVYFFLDWLRDPEFTTVKVVGPSENHLQDNLFSHLIELHRSASIPLPGIIGDLFMGLNLRSRRGSISGVVIPLGKRAAGRLQGTKRFPRAKPHPTFGPLSRLRVLLDEVEHIPQGIWSDIDNLVSNTEELHGLKIVGAFNPKDPTGPCGIRCEPPGGWNSFKIEEDELWVSKRGWSVVRLDAERSENVVAGKVVFPGLQSAEGLAALVSSSGGVTAPNYYTFGRAAFPPLGASFSVFPGGTIAKLKGKPIWYEAPMRCGAADIALEGGDNPVFASGEYGLASGLIKPATVDFPQGERVMFKNEKGHSQLRPMVYCDQLFSLQTGDTMSVSRQIVDLAKKLDIKPEWFIMDRTGNGAGVHDVVMETWSGGVRGLNYSETATERKILIEDSKTPKESYYRAVSELWFAAEKWTRAGSALLNPEILSEKLLGQLSGRLYQAMGLLDKVESKRDYKSRNNPSPDEADAWTLLIHVVRLASGATPGVTVTGAAEAAGLAGDDDEAIVDRTNSLLEDEDFS